MKTENAVTVVLLAGGAATRLPGKLALPVGGEAMLVRVYKQLTRSGLACVLSVREPLPFDLGSRLPSPQIVDKYTDGGPLGGLLSAAERVGTPLLFATAGDLPNIDDGVVMTLVTMYLDARHSGDATPCAVLPRHPDGTVEPLAALYDTASLRNSAARALASGRKKVTDALDGLDVIYYDIPASEQDKFLNVNTAEDFAKIRTP